MVQYIDLFGRVDYSKPPSMLIFKKLISTVYAKQGPTWAVDAEMHLP
jgi:hypothetical protein